MSSHLNAKGRAVMVDITEKKTSTRTAVAEGWLAAGQEVVTAIRENSLKKGDALAVARVAGIMAAKNTSRVIPLCHDIALGSCTIDFELFDQDICVVSRVMCQAQTGAEMEALNAVATALLTLYDMGKSINKSMEINRIHLISKTGGKSGDFKWDEAT